MPRLRPRGDVEPRRRRRRWASPVPAGRRRARPRAAVAVRRAGEVGRLAPEPPGRPPAAASQEHGCVRRPRLPRLHCPLELASIDRIRAAEGFGVGAQPCTVFDAVSAVVCLCRTRAVMHDGGGGGDPEAPAPLFFSADAGGRVGAKRGYYGNCVTAQLVVEKSGTVAGRDVVELAKKISDSKKKMPAADHPPRAVSGHQMVIGQDRYNMPIVSSWMNLGLDEVDLGCQLWHAGEHSATGTREGALPGVRGAAAVQTETAQMCLPLSSRRSMRMPSSNN